MTPENFVILNSNNFGIFQWTDINSLYDAFYLFFRFFLFFYYGYFTVTPGDKWCQGKLEFMLSQRGKPLLVHDGYSFGIQYIRKDKKYWQCNLSRKYNCKARVTTTDTGEIIVTNNEHCHTEIRQHLKKEYKNKMLLNHSLNLSTQPNGGAGSGTNNNHENNTSNNNNNDSNEETNNNNSNNNGNSVRASSSDSNWNFKKELM